MYPSKEVGHFFLPAIFNVKKRENIPIYLVCSYPYLSLAKEVNKKQCVTDLISFICSEWETRALLSSNRFK